MKYFSSEIEVLATPLSIMRIRMSVKTAALSKILNRSDAPPVEKILISENTGDPFSTSEFLTLPSIIVENKERKNRVF